MHAHHPPPPRDLDVIRLVTTFRQLRAGQIQQVLFHENASKTALDVCLKRLFTRGLLHRLPRLSPGGYGGGASQYVYTVTAKGLKAAGLPGKPHRYSGGDNHTLAIADAFIALLEAERAGKLVVEAFKTEPDCHMQLDDIYLKPDARVTVSRAGERLELWLELDRGTERDEKLFSKFSRYWRAHLAWRSEDVYPLVLFSVPDVQRQAYVDKSIAAGPEGSGDIFATCLTTELVAWVMHSLSTEA